MGLVHFDRSWCNRDHTQAGFLASLSSQPGRHLPPLSLLRLLATTPYEEAIGAYLVSAIAFVLLGLSGYFEKVIRLIPSGIAAGLLAGILLQFGIGAFGGMSVDPLLAGMLILAYVVLKRFTARYAVVGILLLGVVLLLVQERVDLSALELRLAAPVFTMPSFSFNALLSVALPLFLITLTGQYMPGMLVLRNDGFKTSANPILTITGLGSLLMAPFGSHAFNVAAITAAICTGKEAHDDPSKRWVAGIAAGVFYILVGVFGVTLAAVFMAFPQAFISTLAGLALLGTIGGSLASAMDDPKSRGSGSDHFPGICREYHAVGDWRCLLGISDRPGILPCAQWSLATPPDR